MGLPGFSAAASLHHAHNLWKRGEHIHTVISDAASVGVRGSVVPQLCPPPGTCAKAFRLCRDPTAGQDDWIMSRPPTGNWCAIAARCFECYEF